MMTSYIENIPTIVKVVAEMKPKHILDVGAGFGKYGLLIREALLSNMATKDNLKPVPDFRIDGNESAEYFLNQKAFYRIYDGVCVGDIRKAIPELLLDFDLILLIDVIEHWPKEDFYKFMDKISPNTRVLVSTPRKLSFYKERYYDTDPHITQFSEGDFHDYVDNLSNDKSLIYLL